MNYAFYEIANINRSDSYMYGDALYTQNNDLFHHNSKVIHM